MKGLKNEMNNFLFTKGKTKMFTKTNKHNSVHRKQDKTKQLGCL